MKQYLDLLDRIIKEGNPRKDRTGTGTIGVFGHQMRFDMKEGFPLLTTKKLHLKSIIHELLWFLQGGTNIKYLNDNGVTIWDEWADKDGNLGPIYGAQWRNWNRYEFEDAPYGEVYTKRIDQISNLINTLKTNPDNRRMLVSAWNVGEMQDMLFPPCHYGFQVYTIEMSFDDKMAYARSLYGKDKWWNVNDERVVKILTTPKRYISLMWNQRSVDTFLGLPFNIASYAMLLQMIAQVVDMVPDELICSLGDTHLYLNHIEQAKLQLTREPRPLPKMILKEGHIDMDNWKYEDFILTDYNPCPHIKGDISI